MCNGVGGAGNAGAAVAAANDRVQVSNTPVAPASNPVAADRSSANVAVNPLNLSDTLAELMQILQAGISQEGIA
jgi:hypothetical protein